MSEIKFQEIGGQILLSKRDFEFLKTLSKDIKFVPFNESYPESDELANEDLDFWQEEIEEKVWNEV